MKGAIAYALNYPHRLSHATPAMDWNVKHNWSFEPIDTKRFPAIALARHCGELGGAMPAIFNAANEIAVAGFIDEKIKFTSILPVIEAVVASNAGAEKTRLRDLSDVSAIEDNARAQAHEQLVRLAP